MLSNCAEINPSFIFTVSPVGIFSPVFSMSWLLSISVQVGLDSVWPNPFWYQFWKQLCFFKYAHILELQIRGLRFVLKEFLFDLSPPSSHPSDLLLYTRRITNSSSNQVYQSSRNSSKFPECGCHTTALRQLLFYFPVGIREGRKVCS